MLEALSRGVPVVCLDHQGAGDVVTSDCGVKIPVSNPKRVIEGLSLVLEELAHDPDRLDVLSIGALRRAEEFLWYRQGVRLAGIYRKVLSDLSMSGRIDPEARLLSESESAKSNTILERP